MDSAAPKPRVSDIVQVMERWAPTWTAESWDRVGLLAGDPAAEVPKALVALELTAAILDRARQTGARMILTHHPPLFKPLNNLRMDNPATARLVEAAASGIALFAAHTNLDAAKPGVNDALAHRLGLVDTAILDPAPADSQLKLVAFVPPSHSGQVADAVFGAGAGVIGDYRRCCFAADGHGSYLAPADGKPFAGQPGAEHSEPEVRLETVLPKALAGRVVAALLKAHPYEEPAFDLYPLMQPPSGVGIGRLGRPAAPVSGAEFLANAAKELGSAAPHICGPVPEKVERIAVVGGSGGDFLGQAAAAGAQILVTGEASYHAADQAVDIGVCLACLGHFETENVITKPWAGRLSEILTDQGFSCDIQACVDSESPWRPVR